MVDGGFISGYLQKEREGFFGEIAVEGVSLSPIEGVYFKEKGENYLWLKRRPILEYDPSVEAYKTRARQPKWECYLKKLMDGDVVAYRGEFVFMHFKFSIVGVWDSVLGMDRNRLNLFVERLPMNKQSIINSINERKRNERRRSY